MRLVRVEHSGANSHSHAFADRALRTQFLSRATCVGGHRLLDRCQLRQPLAKHSTATDLLLRRVSLIQLEAGRAGELARGLLHHHTEFVAQHPRIGLRQVHGHADAHRLEVRRHSPADAPHLFHLGVA